MLETHARFLPSAVTYVHQGTALISLLQGGHKEAHSNVQKSLDTRQTFSLHRHSSSYICIYCISCIRCSCMKTFFVKEFVRPQEE